MPGISDLDTVCLGEIFKNLTLLDLCSMRQCDKRLRYFVDDYLHSLYVIREQWFDFSIVTVSENEWPNLKKDFRNMLRILSSIGKFVRYLKICQDIRASIMLDVIANNCGDILKGLALTNLDFHQIKMKKYAGLFNNLEVLELVGGDGDRQGIENFLLEHEYPNLTTLKIAGRFGLSDESKTDIIKKFFMKKRSIKKLTCGTIHNDNDFLPLIVQNASEIDFMQMFLREEVANVTLLAQLRNLKGLQINCGGQRSTIALIKELSTNTQLEMLGIQCVEFNDELLDAVSNLTNLKVLRLAVVGFRLNRESIEMLPRKLSKLEWLKLKNCYDIPYRMILAALCKSDKFRTIYVWCSEDRDNFIQQMVTDFIERRAHCLVIGNPLCIYLWEPMFDYVKRWLTKYNFEYENIKILRAKNELLSDV